MSLTDASKRTVRFAAAGDLLLCPGPQGTPYLRDPRLISSEVRSLLAECDVAFANLEFTLPSDGSCVSTEPRVVGTPELVRFVAAAGFNVLALANNHAFDCLDGGFQNLRGLLDELGIRHFGAGMNLDEAAAPAIVERNGLRVALLGAVDQRSGAYQFAASDRWGVAPLSIDRLTSQIRDLRKRVHHVIVSIHWGEERFLVPSPLQIEQAHALVDAGASMILGHHPHVLQAMELHDGAPIVYSLGNFIADEVYFSRENVLRWNRTERTGYILLAELGDGTVANVRQVPTCDPGKLVEIDRSGFGLRRIEKTRRAIAKGVTLARYRREHLWVKTVKPILAHLQWSQLKRLRPRQIWRAFHKFLQACRAR